ncbi:MAG: FkbM family methyltransferase [Anaerolineaceae bacterium]|nr:FkbM family methyltransferase [Anaerolineaceae bacterium]
MTLIEYLNRPEYFFQPAQILHRILKSRTKSTNELEKVNLPWGVEIEIRPQEVIGHSLWKMGIYDLSMTEVLWRLTNPGEMAVDVGANIGYTTSILAKQVGQNGSVVSFEPHPFIYQELNNNVNNWRHDLGWRYIVTHSLALSSQSGNCDLAIPQDFHVNRGTAYVANSGHQPDTVTVKAQRSTLDSMIQARIDILKIDVEGHEFEVLKGARHLLKFHQIRDIVFEEQHDYPSEVTQLLEAYGYIIYRIRKGFWKPILEHPSKTKINHSWEPTNYLATTQPVRALDRFKKKGWHSLELLKRLR